MFLRLTRVPVTLQETANEINKMKRQFLLVFVTMRIEVDLDFQEINL